ncbi:MAG: hypothetical protein GY749_09890, partial [Desulfobacteraceae bacterium]|nr:hypothetical protein [Desulfobacteraceae bacterium]
CAEAGAKKIYAVEENSAACQAARKIISQKGLADKIELIHGLSVETELPEKADICLSELIGCIGNSEGTACYLNDAKRFLKPDGIMIPEGCLTLLSPAVKPSEIYKDKFLDDLMESYEDAIYEKMGRKFPFTRYYIHNFPKSDIIAPPQVFEEMWFNDELITEHFDKVLEFQAMKNSLFDGLLLWINLHVGTDVIIDVMNTVTHWASTFIPMEPFDVRQGDFIEVRCLSEKASGMANPDYFFEARIKRDDMVVYNCSTESCYMPNE